MLVQIAHCLKIFILYVLPWVLVLIPVRFLTRLPSHIFRKLLHIVAFTCVTVMILAAECWQAAALTAILIAVAVYPILALLESSPWFSMLFVQKSKREIKGIIMKDHSLIAANITEIKEKIREACARVGRDPSEVTLCAVSKMKPVEDIEDALAVGQRIFGENYVQELCGKYEALKNSDIEWHMIGHLQRNKVKNIIDKTALIHSVDSLRLAQQIEKDAAKIDRTVDILLEVNAAEEETKFGFSMEEIPGAVCEIGRMKHIRVRGLMTSAPYTEDPETNRIHFRHMKELLDQLRASAVPGEEPDILSMGMTGDYQVAVEEGATIIRVGTAIFGERKKED